MGASNSTAISHDAIFTDDPRVLLSPGKLAVFTTDTPNQTANTIMRVVIYMVIGAVVYKFSNSPNLFYLILGVLSAVLMNAALQYLSPPVAEPPMDTMHEGVNTDAGGKSEATLADEVLLNVRERSHRLAGHLGVPSGSGGEEFMFGGTRLATPAPTRETRDHVRFTGNTDAGHTGGVTYSPVIGSRGI